MSLEIPCYVLDTGQRVHRQDCGDRNADRLKGGGSFEKTQALRLLNRSSYKLVLEQLVPFRLPEVEGLTGP